MQTKEVLEELFNFIIENTCTIENACGFYEEYIYCEEILDKIKELSKKTIDKQSIM